jgi:hypothetical protein
VSDEDELQKLRAQAKEDRKLIQKAERVLGEIDRGPGLRADQADVLAALRIRLEGKERKSLEDLLTAAGDIGAKKDLGSALTDAEGVTSDTGDWPVVEDKKKDWPGL